ncbi:FitA-like ribbon-helix-helix domain-containing protein [Streptomyces sp. NPDC087226]|jgi:plasmid stability protein|uniref:FitA-like ribbon-helix-helix domain-containing protein n=1 Tax=Streptomyces sp. NPDC087226 TaxID=3365771 RepID=UPI0037A3305B
MATIHVRDVPEDTLQTLKTRAAQSGQSLQNYVLQLLTGEAAMLSPAEAAREARAIAARGDVTADDISEVIHEMREARG